MNELAVAGLDTNSTVIAQVRRDSDEKIWCVTHSAFEVYSDAEAALGNYDVELTEQGGSGYYVGDMPSGITDTGFFNVSFYLKNGTAYDFQTAGTLTYNSYTGSEDEPTGLNWVTREKFKTLYGSDFSDDQIDIALTVASVMGNNYLDRTIRQTAHAEIHRLDGRPMNLRSYPVQSITRITFNPYSDNPEIIDGSNFFVNEVGSVFTKGSCASIDPCYRTSGFAKVEYVGGYAVVPADLQWCAMEISNNMMSMADPDYRVVQKSIKDVSVQYAVFASDNKNALFKDAGAILDTYRMPICI